MRFPNMASLSVFAVLAAPCAFAQDRIDPPALDVRVEPVDHDFAKIDVARLDADLGDVVIVVCGLPQDGDEPKELDPMGLEPLLLVQARDPRLQSLAIEPVQLAKLPIGIFAVALDRTGRVHFSPVKTARALAEELEAARPEPVDVREPKASYLPELHIDVVSTDGIPPEFGLAISAWVHPVGQKLVVDAVNWDDRAKAPRNIEVYLTLDAGGMGQRSQFMPEELHAFAPLGYASGARVGVWLRASDGCVFGEYELVRELTIEE